MLLKHENCVQFKQVNLILARAPGMGQRLLALRNHWLRREIFCDSDTILKKKFRMQFIVKFITTSRTLSLYLFDRTSLAEYNTHCWNPIGQTCRNFVQKVNFLMTHLFLGKLISILKWSVAHFSKVARGIFLPCNLKWLNCYNQPKFNNSSISL